MNKEYFESSAIFYANWNGHSSFPRYYGVRDAFIDALSAEEKDAMTKQGFFEHGNENSKRLDNAIQRTSGKDTVDPDFYAMVEEVMKKISDEENAPQP